MSNLLRVAVVLLLVLSLVAAVLELGLFKQREELKARNQLLGKGVATLASHIESPTGAVSDLATKDFPRIQVTEEQLKQFYRLGADGKPEVDASGKKVIALDGLLNELGGKAAIQYSRLNDTRGELTTTRDELSTTKTTLKETEDNLVAAKKENAEKANTIASQTTTIDEQKQQLATLEEEKEKSLTKIDQLTAEVAKLGDAVTDRDQKLEATKRYVRDLENKIRLLTGALEGGGTNAPPPGLQGQIVVVNSNWNFVVIDVLPEGQIVNSTDLIVQRDRKLVGKVRVSGYLQDRRFAIAEILTDWNQELPVTAGDYVFY